MTTQHAVTLLCALGNETRLNVFRYLTRFGPDGVAAKDIAEARRGGTEQPVVSSQGVEIRRPCRAPPRRA